MVPSHQPLVDVHVHLVALPTQTNGCYLSPRVLAGPLARWLLWTWGIDPSDPARANARYLDRLAELVRGSRRLRAAVLLALDGAYGPDGRPDARHTHFRIDNDLVLAVCRERPEFWPGVSVNPLRRDALDELERCAAAGAVLVKWLPNAQDFSPADRRCRPFYRRLAELRLPLLSHSGSEFAMPDLDPKLGDPGLLRSALDEGATVISAHGGSAGQFLHEPYFPTLLWLARQYPRYYLDSSALSLPNRMRMALLLRRSPELLDRLLPGSDYPVPVWARSFTLQVPFRRMNEIARQANPFDRNLDVQEAIGLRFADLPAGTRLGERAMVCVPV